MDGRHTKFNQQIEGKRPPASPVLRRETNIKTHNEQLSSPETFDVWIHYAQYKTVRPHVNTVR